MKILFAIWYIIIAIFVYEIVRINTIEFKYSNSIALVYALFWPVSISLSVIVIIILNVLNI